MLEEIPRGISEMHNDGQTFAKKVIRAGYFWARLQDDCSEWVQNCEKCQKFAVVKHIMPKELHNILPLWPLDKWGIDIIGPFPVARGQLKFLLVAIDYFTRW